jgi:diaminopimelate decarboxylase
MTAPVSRVLLPDNSTVDGAGRLSIARVDVLDLAEEWGTPLFVYDEDHLRARCREAVAGFGDGVAYAAKAFFNLEMARLVAEEGLHVDVATGGELHVALRGGIPTGRVIMHGNNKSAAELEMALDAGVGRIVIDSFDEMDLLEELLSTAGSRARVLLRITPGVEAHTHEYLQTGVADSKFGFDLASGVAQEAVERALASSHLELIGLHAHIGSQVFAGESYARAVDRLGPFVVPLGLPELSIGGGLGVAYVAGESAPTITEWAATIHRAVAEAGIQARILAEPGRSIAASAAVTLYTVGTIKEIDRIRTYVAVDGGMSDNPRPVLYGSGYEAFLPRATNAPRSREVRIVGKHCESGDVIVDNALVPDDLKVGDVLCTPVTGAYGFSMGSNYNLVTRPAVVFVSGGNARLVTRRETLSDLTRRDVGWAGDVPITSQSG